MSAKLPWSQPQGSSSNRELEDNEIYDSAIGTSTYTTARTNDVEFPPKLEETLEVRAKGKFFYVRYWKRPQKFHKLELDHLVLSKKIRNKYLETVNLNTRKPFYKFKIIFETYYIDGP